MKKKDKSLLIEEFGSGLAYARACLLLIARGILDEIKTGSQGGRLISGMTLEDLRVIKFENKKYKLSATIRKLRKQKIIEVDENRGKQIINLTEQGRLRALRIAIEQTSKLLPSKYLCLVLFDIPERLRGERTSFRKLLKKAGFVKSQKSVWLGTRDVVNYLNAYVKYMGVGSHVHIFLVVKDNSIRSI